MEEKWPCLFGNCTNDGKHGVEFDDSLDSGTIVCDTHLLEILENKENNQFLFRYSLDDYEKIRG